MRITIIIAITILSYHNISAQFEQGIGEWISYLSYNDGRLVTQSDTKVYYATDLSLFSIDKADVTDFMFQSKVEGLTDVGIRRIKYNDFTEQLIVVYDNSNIDIVGDGEVINISDVKNNQILTGDRSINDIHIVDEETVFFATAFGILEFNIARLEFTSTIFTDLQVNDMTSDENTLYAATADGVFYIDIAGSQNIADFSAWNRFESQDSFPDGFAVENIEIFDGSLYADLGDFMIKGGIDEDFVSIPLLGYEDHDINYFSLGRSRLIVGVQKGINGRAIFIDESGIQKADQTQCANLTRFAVEDQMGRLWFADGFGNIRWAESDSSPCNYTRTNTPATDKASDIDIRDGVVYVATGGVADNYTPLSNRDGFFILEDGIWSTFRKETIPETADIEFINIFQIETHPSDERVFVASYYEGLLEYNPETMEAIVHKENNSPISGTVGDEQRERISGLDFDRDEVLWMNNFGAVTPLIAYTPEGIFHAFDPAGDNQLAKVTVDGNGYLWSVLITAGGGVVVYNTNGTIADPSDDQSILINTSNSALTTGTVNTVAVDLDGEVWVGTNQGPIVFDSSPSLFDGMNLGTQRQVLQDSIGAFLLETEDITAIAFDGANRKWFGSRNGIFVQTPDAKELVMKFDVDNSPLFSNEIAHLQYDGETGIMYIATSKGMQSYRTETLEGKSVHDRQVYAYPNPVRPDHTGPIAIRGLARDATVKITDLNGKLVYETTALGGQAIWDGADYTGRRAQTGVYYVFSTGAASFDTPDSFVTKILIVK